MATNESLLEIMEETSLVDCKEIVPGYVYHYRRKRSYDEGWNIFTLYDGRMMNYNIIEYLIIVKDGVKVGIAMRYSIYDIHIVIKPEYRNCNIMSDFARSGIMKKMWPGNRKVELCGIYDWDEYHKKLHLLELFGLKAYNIAEIEEGLNKYAGNQERMDNWYRVCKIIRRNK